MKIRSAVSSATLAVFLSAVLLAYGAAPASAAVPSSWQPTRQVPLPPGITDNWAITKPLYTRAGDVWEFMVGGDRNDLDPGTAVWHHTAGAWTLERLTSADGDRVAASAIDGTGRIHVLIDHPVPSGRAILYAVRDSGGWSVTDTGLVGGSDGPFRGFRLATTPAGDAVGLAGIGDSLVVIGNAGGAWHILRTFEPTFASLQAELAVSPSGSVHVVEGEIMGNAVDGLWDWTDASGTWRSSLVTAGYARLGAIAFDRSDVLHVAYTTGVVYEDDYLVYASPGTDGWTSQITDRTGCRSEFALTFDEADVPVITWSREKLFCPFGTSAVAFEDGTWTASVVTTDISVGPVLLASPAGRRVIWFNDSNGFHQMTWLPTLTLTAPTFAPRTGASLAGTSIPGWLTWAKASGAARYQVARSTTGGASWTTLSSSLTGTSANVTAASSGTTRFRIRAINSAGAAGAWATGPVLTPRLFQQGTSAARYAGTWTSSRSSALSGGTAKYAKAARASATYTFTGRTIALVTTKAAARGKAKVYVDGGYVGTIDLYRATSQYRVVAWQRTWAASGTHTLKVVVVGTAGRPRVDIDAFIVLK